MEFYKKYALKTKEEEEKEFCIFVEGVRLKLQKCL